jgi:hypothetical protein
MNFLRLQGRKLSLTAPFSFHDTFNKEIFNKKNHEKLLKDRRVQKQIVFGCRAYTISIKDRERGQRIKNKNFSSDL